MVSPLKIYLSSLSMERKKFYKSVINLVGLGGRLIWNNKEKLSIFQELEGKKHESKFL